MKFRTAYPIAALAASMLMTSVTAEAAGTAIRGRFSFDALATCQQPAITNPPVHAEGTAALSVDRTATLDMASNVQGSEHYTPPRWAAGRLRRREARPLYAWSAGIRLGRSATTRTIRLSST
jgi:hypothetical protein